MDLFGQPSELGLISIIPNLFRSTGCVMLLLDWPFLFERCSHPEIIFNTTNNLSEGFMNDRKLQYVFETA